MQQLYADLSGDPWMSDPLVRATFWMFRYLGDPDTRLVMKPYV